MNKKLFTSIVLLMFSSQTIAEGFTFRQPLIGVKASSGSIGEDSEPSNLEDDLNEWKQFALDNGLFTPPTEPWNYLYWVSGSNSTKVLDTLPTSPYPGAAYFNEITLRGHNFTTIPSFSRLIAQDENSGNSFMISDNRNLLEINTFNKLKSVNYLYISGNDSLINVEFQELEEVKGQYSNFYIQDNPSLSNISLPNVSRLGAHNIFDNNNLSNLNFLSGVNSAGRYISAKENPLTDISGLENIIFDDEYGYVYIEDNYTGPMLDPNSTFCTHNTYEWGVMESNSCSKGVCVVTNRSLTRADLCE